MKKNKIAQIILALILKIKVKDKRIKYIALAVLGVALIVSTQGSEDISQVITSILENLI